MRRAASFVVVCAACTPACGGDLARRATTLERQAREPAAVAELHVEGHRLTKDGRAFRLLGVNHSGTEYACVATDAVLEGPSDEQLTRAMHAWHVNAVRVPLNEDCWLGINGARVAGAPYRSAITELVRRLVLTGMVVVLDLHWSAPGALLAKQQEPMADEDHATDFWRSVASAFKGEPSVMFDLFNEPFLTASQVAPSDVWDCWLRGCVVTPSPDARGGWRSAGMQSMVDAVRDTGATNVILAGGLAYANDLSGWLAHAPHDPLSQLAASFHVYDFNECVTEACWTTQVAPVALAVPVVTGEIGESDCGHAFIDAYMAWADAHGASYLGWAWNTWDCRKGPAFISDYAGTPTPFGVGLQAHLLRVAP